MMVSRELVRVYAPSAVVSAARYICRCVADVTQRQSSRSIPKRKSKKRNVNFPFVDRTSSVEREHTVRGADLNRNHQSHRKKLPNSFFLVVVAL